MTTDRCPRVRLDLAEFVGGDLAAERHESVRQHLLGCVDCRGEASALQKARKVLRRAAAVVPSGVDDAMFAALHADITAAIGREVATVGSPRRGRVLPKVLLALAAGLLFGFGYWLVTGDDDAGVFGRSPLPTVQSTNAPLRAVPWAGPRARLQQLGFDEVDGAPAGSGMMQRLRARDGAIEGLGRR